MVKSFCFLLVKEVTCIILSIYIFVSSSQAVSTLATIRCINPHHAWCASDCPCPHSHCRLLVSLLDNAFQYVLSSHIENTSCCPICLHPLVQTSWLSFLSVDCTVLGLLEPSYCSGDGGWHSDFLGNCPILSQNVVLLFPRVFELVVVCLI